MALTLTPTFCSCDKSEKSSLLGNEKPSCYAGVYYVVGQLYRRDVLPHSEKTVSPVQTPQRERGNVDRDRTYHSPEPQLAVVRPVGSTPSPSSLPETRERNMTVEPQPRTPNTVFPVGPPPPPPAFENPKNKTVTVRIDIAQEIQNWHKSGKKLRPAASKTQRQNKATVLPMASLPTEGEIVVERGQREKKFITMEKVSDRDMVKAAVLIRAPAIRGDENSSEEEESEEDEEDSGLEDNINARNRNNIST